MNLTYRILLTTGALACILLTTLPIAEGLNDPFHQGEFHAYTMSLIHSVQPSLSIHGTLDAIPALITGLLFGFDQHFLATTTSYKLLDIVAVLLLIACAHRLRKSKPGHIWLLLGVSLVGGHLVGFRDIFLLTSILLFFKQTEIKNNAKRYIANQVLFGFVVALGVHWSYDRGLIGAGSLGVATLYLSTKNKKHLLSIAAFGTTLLTMHFLHDALSLEQYLTSIFSLAESSPQWKNEWSTRTISLTILVTGLTGITLCASILAARNHPSSYSSIGILIALTLISIGMARIATNRMDFQHAAMGLWAPLLVMAHSNWNRGWRTRALFATYAALLALTIKTANFATGLQVAALLFLIPFSTKLGENRLNKTKSLAIVLSLITLFCAWNIVRYGVKRDHYEWLSEPIIGQLNYEVSPKGNAWAANELTKLNAKCVMDMTNNGLINGLTQLPSCTWFTYPIYTPYHDEQKLIDQLHESSPPAVVYSTSFRSYAFNDKPMDARLPTLNEYIVKNYPKMTCKYDYCIRYKR